MEMAGREYIPRRARPRFGAGAFEGSVVPASTPTSDMSYADPAPLRPPQPFPVTPVNPTAFSVGNKVRLGIVGIMSEWWVSRPISNGQIFVAAPQEFTRTAARRMGRVRALNRLVPNRRVVYDAQSYGPQAQGKALPKRGG